MERTKQGEFAWTDLSATDLEGQTAFYEGLFGWEHDDEPMGEGSIYRMFTLGGGNVAGASVMPADMQQKGVPPMWNAYIAVTDLDASLARAVELGAQVFMPVSPAGPKSRSAGIMDPTGAPVFLWQNAEPDEKLVYMMPGAVVWNDLVTRDPAKATDFFTKLVGWDIVKMDQGPMPYWQINIVGIGEGGIMPTPEMMPPEVPSYWLTYFGTADIQASVAKAKELGATAMVEPTEVGDMLWFAVITDPAGATFGMMQALMKM